jgi:mannose-6-phosphate isomerase-like protein (cupin superfamily)
MIIKQDSVEPLDFGGLRVYDYTAGHETSSSLAVIHVPPGVRHAEAWSKRSDKYYYVLAGQVRFTLDGNQHNLAAGDFCLVRQGQRFWYENREEDLATLLLVHTPSFDLDSEVFVGGSP